MIRKQAENCVKVTRSGRNLNFSMLEAYVIIKLAMK